MMRIAKTVAFVSFAYAAQNDKYTEEEFNDKIVKAKDDTAFQGLVDANFPKTSEKAAAKTSYDKLTEALTDFDAKVTADTKLTPEQKNNTAKFKALLVARQTELKTASEAVAADQGQGTEKKNKENPEGKGPAPAVKAGEKIPDPVLAEDKPEADITKTVDEAYPTAKESDKVDDLKARQKKLKEQYEAQEKASKEGTDDATKAKAAKWAKALKTKLDAYNTAIENAEGGGWFYPCLAIVVVVLILIVIGVVVYKKKQAEKKKKAEEEQKAKENEETDTEETEDEEGLGKGGFYGAF